VFPDASFRDTDDNATVKAVYELFEDGWTGRTIMSPWNLAVSMPPKSMEPVFESSRS